MTSDTDTLKARVGARLRTLRRARDLSQRDEAIRVINAILSARSKTPPEDK